MVQEIHVKTESQEQKGSGEELATPEGGEETPFEELMEAEKGRLEAMASVAKSKVARLVLAGFLLTSTVAEIGCKREERTGEEQRIEYAATGDEQLVRQAIKLLQQIPENQEGFTEAQSEAKRRRAAIDIMHEVLKKMNKDQGLLDELARDIKDSQPKDLEWFMEDTRREAKPNVKVRSESQGYEEKKEARTTSPEERAQRLLEGFKIGRAAQPEVYRQEIEQYLASFPEKEKGNAIQILILAMENMKQEKNGRFTLPINQEAHRIILNFIREHAQYR